MKKPKGQLFGMIVILLTSLAACAFGAANRTYYVDSKNGCDGNDGLVPQRAWQTLQKASARKYAEGEQILLRKGCVFEGELLLQATGSAQGIVVVGAYAANGDDAPLPVINAKGFLAGVQIADSVYVEIRDLEIMADAGEPAEKAADTMRYGVFLAVEKEGAYGHITLRSLRIHDIFATTASPSEGKNSTTSKGVGIAVEGRKSATLNDIHIENCVIEKTGWNGISLKHSDGVCVVSNTLRAIGGPGIQPSNCRNLVVHGNLVDHSGSYVDPRMHGRGSGIWPWGCTDVLIEQNAFLHARGKMDSCGAHIDFNNRNVVVQRNLSVDNEGGFIEILGNDYNCAYRYNISINDGARVNGRGGAKADGRTLQVSGYVGAKNKPLGPFNSYIYNNTIIVKADIRAGFEVESTAQGVLVANNIFYIQGAAKNILPPWIQKKAKGAKFQNVIFKNNIATRRLPEDIYTQNIGERSDNPQFRNPGGFNPADYIPGNQAVVKGRGAVISALPGDTVGLKIGLQAETDFFGTPIPKGLPDIGAVVFGGGLKPMVPFVAKGLAPLPLKPTP